MVGKMEGEGNLAAGGSVVTKGVGTELFSHNTPHYIHTGSSGLRDLILESSQRPQDRINGLVEQVPSVALFQQGIGNRLVEESAVFLVVFFFVGVVKALAAGVDHHAAAYI